MALLVGLGISILITSITVVMHFVIYGIFANEFRDFFGVSVGVFKWWKYLIYFTFWTIIFTMVFSKEWELL
jgi:hypothetical protein